MRRGSDGLQCNEEVTSRAREANFEAQEVISSLKLLGKALLEGRFVRCGNTSV